MEIINIDCSDKYYWEPILKDIPWKDVGCTFDKFEDVSLLTMKRRSFIKFSTLEKYTKIISDGLHTSEIVITDNSKLFFEEGVKFPRRKLTDISKYSKIKGLKPVRKIDNCDIIVMNKVQTKMLLDKSLPDKREYKNNYYDTKLIIFAKTGINILGSTYNNKLVLDYDLTPENYEKSEYKSHIESVCSKDNFLEATMFCSLSPYGMEHIFNNSVVNAINSGKPIIDISTLYKAIGSDIMDYDAFKRVDHALNSAIGSKLDNTQMAKFIGENFGSYDVEKSVFYLSILFKKYFKNRKHLMNTNIKSLYEFCDKIAGFHNDYISMMKNISIAGYEMQVPASFIYSFTNVEKQIKNIKYSLHTLGMSSNVKVDILDSLKKHVIFDIDITKINSELNQD